MIAADSISACFCRATGCMPGSSRGISARMIAGIIWKVDALPTPVAKNRIMNIAKNPQNASG